MDLEFKNPIFVDALRNFLMPIPLQNGNGSPDPQSSPSLTSHYQAGGKKRKIAGGPVQPKIAVVTERV